MSKLQSWERDDAMHDYIKWQEELDRLQAECPDDVEEIENVKKRIADYEDALFGCDETEEESDENEEEE